MKGVLAIEGCDDRYVFQGVHALFEGMPDKPWEDGVARSSKLVFIGKDLDRDELEAGIQSLCCWSERWGCLPVSLGS